MRGRWLKIGFACIGMTGIMTACYAMPYEEYEIKGRVTDEEGNPVEGIRVFSQDNGQGETRTSKDGTYDLKIWDRNIEGVVLMVEDTDGATNGGEFLAEEKELGNAAEEVNFRLTRK